MLASNGHFGGSGQSAQPLPFRCNDMTDRLPAFPEHGAGLTEMFYRSRIRQNSAMHHLHLRILTNPAPLHSTHTRAEFDRRFPPG